MKNNKLNTMLFTAILAYALTGCAFDPENADTDPVPANTLSTEMTEITSASSAASSVITDTSAIITASPVSYTTTLSAIDTSSLFTDRDLENTPDLKNAKELKVSDGETVEITEEGVYLLSGSAKNCTVKVNADKKAKVQLVLNGVSITNSDSPAIYVISADKVFVTTAENTENTLTVTDTFKADGDIKTDAVIFSKSDLVLNGLGKLDIQSKSGNGVTSKDDLKVTGGTYTMNTALDSLEANDLIAVSGGIFTVDTQKDALHCDSYVYIKDGTFTINAKSDGIQGDVVVQIDGGSMKIDSSEGIESTYVQINGGTISINASDDGINASQKCEGQTPTVEITGGDITIVMAKGDTDGIDANGIIKVSGGKIDVTAPCMSFDYDKNAEYTGGTIIINGEEVNKIPEETMGGPGGGRGMMGGGPGGFGGQKPDGFTKPENGQMPEGFTKPENGQMPEGFTKPENGEMPEGFTKPENGFRKSGKDSDSNAQNSGSDKTTQKKRTQISEPTAEKQSETA